jgi:hypothetical protein
MPEVLAFPAGGFRFIKGPFQYSAGVAAEPGFEIERARFRRPVPIEEGFRAIEAYLAARGRPTTAFCACELRSPEPFTEEGFRAFNRVYVRTLERWGLFEDEVNPVARSNVCPEIGKPPGPGFHAFSYTVPAAPGTPPSFITAGSGEAAEGPGSYRERIVRYGDTSPAGLREKARWVLAEQERRLAALGASWAAATATHVYTVHDLHPFLAEELVARGAMPAGLTWHFARPPVQGLDYEMDVRGVAREIVMP